MSAAARPRRRAPAALALTAALTTALLAGCALPPTDDAKPPLRPADARAFIAGLLPASTRDRSGWATDLYAAFAALKLAPNADNACAVIAVVEQESSFKADPAVAGLGAIARREIDARAERAGVPGLLVSAALAIESPNGRSYAERIDAARTERELSDIFDDFIGMVPLGRRLFADWNPVRTGGPMQVRVRFAQQHAAEHPYPYPVDDSLRHEVFTRRGGLYFGIAHLLHYPASYDAMKYRFADFNAGRWSSRNAALQNAISLASGIPLVLDGDLLRADAAADAPPGATEAAARVLAERLRLSHDAIRRDLARGERDDLERSALWERTFALADRIERRALPRAVVPRIQLKSPKITRELTTQWFVDRVEQRYRGCLARAAAREG